MQCAKNRCSLALVTFLYRHLTNCNACRRNRAIFVRLTFGERPEKLPILALLATTTRRGRQRVCHRDRLRHFK